jgi:D-sedoheptulose 7-phosphate isomerase
VDYANEHQAVTIALTGYDGGKLKQLAQHNVHIPIHDMQIAEDLHMILVHCMMQILNNETN